MPRELLPIAAGLVILGGTFAFLRAEQGAAPTPATPEPGTTFTRLPAVAIDPVTGCHYLTGGTMSGHTFATPRLRADGVPGYGCQDARP